MHVCMCACTRALFLSVLLQCILSLLMGVLELPKQFLLAQRLGALESDL